MSEVNWQLGITPDIGGNAMAAFRQGRAERDQRQGQNALSAFVTNPDDPSAQAGLAKYHPEKAWEYKQARQKEQQAKAKQRQVDLPLLGRLLDHAQDETTFQEARAEGERLGLDMSEVPQTFDVQWRNTKLALVKKLQEPGAQEALSTAGKIAVDMGFKPGTPEHAKKTMEIWQVQESKPYVSGGDTRLYTPTLGGQAGGIPQQAIEALRRGEGTPEQFDQMFGPGAAAKAMGGPASQAPGTFP